MRMHLCLCCLLVFVYACSRYKCVHIQRYDCQIQPTTGLSVLPLTNDLKESMTLFVKSLGKWGETGKCLLLTLYKQPLLFPPPHL